MSEPEQGAAFTLRFPVRVPPLAAAEFDAATAARAGDTPSPAVRTPARRPSAKRLREVATAGTAADAPAPQLRCLLAADAVLNLMLVQRLLQAAGFAVETAVNGAEALAKLTAACEAHRPPHVAVIDYQMPHLSGPQVARAFCDWEAAAGVVRTPLFCLTANVMDEHRAEAESAGFCGFLTKPLKADAVAALRACAVQQERLLASGA